jgi:DHA2 family multidrug resistance protein
MMLDRGQRLDWFESEEIVLLSGLGALGLYLFAVHSVTAREPFLDPRLIASRQFFVSLLLISVYGFLTVPVMVLMPTFLADLRGYNIDTIGLLQSPRGVGLLMALFVSGRITGKVDPRILIAIGLVCLGVSGAEMSTWTAEVGPWPIVWTGFLQGVGGGIMLVPIQVTAFSVLASHHRTEAAAVFNLVRSVWSSLGVSVMVTLFVRESSMGRALLVEHITPYSQALRFIGPDAGVDLSTEHGLAVIEHQIELQAAMLGYDAVFLLLAIVACAALPLLLVIGRQRKLERTDPEALVISE